MKTLYRQHNALAATRIRLGLTQEQIAMHLGISVSLVKMVETNRRRLTSDKLAKLAALEIQLASLPIYNKKDTPVSMQAINSKAAERYEMEMKYQRYRCNHQAAQLEKKFKKMQEDYDEVRICLQNLDAMAKLKLDSSDPLVQHLRFSRYRLEQKLNKCNLHAQVMTRKKIALLRAEATLNNSIHTGYAYPTYGTPIIQNLKLKNMSYTLSMISNRADCQVMIDTANDDKDSLVYRKTGLERQQQNATDTTFDIAAELAAVTAEIDALQVVINNLPDGTTKEDNKVKLTKAQYKKFLLDQRKGNYGSVALIGKEYDIACLERTIAETDAFIQELNTRMNELPTP